MDFGYRARVQWPRRRVACTPILFAALLSLQCPVAAHHSLELRQQVGKNVVLLNVPAEGSVAGQPEACTVQVRSASDPGGGEEPISCKTLTVEVTMPAMQGMPAIVPSLTPLADPGLMGFSITYPHGGAYRITVLVDDGASFDAAFDVVVGDPAASDGSMAGAPFSLQLTANPKQPSAGDTVKLTLSVLNNETGQTVTDFDTVHEKKMHLFIVRSDLSQFFHVHPAPNPDGSFTYSFTFPTGGEWRIFADTAPHNLGSWVTSATLSVAGPSLPLDVPDPLAPPTWSSVADGLTLMLTPGPLQAHDTLQLTFVLLDGKNRPVTDIEPWLGADAHLMLIDSTATLFVHSHPSVRSAEEREDGRLTFVTQMPRPGRYKGWVQLQVGGKIHTFVFLVNAA